MHSAARKLKSTQSLCGYCPVRHTDEATRSFTELLLSDLFCDSCLSSTTRFLGFRPHDAGSRCWLRFLLLLPHHGGRANLEMFYVVSGFWEWSGAALIPVEWSSLGKCSGWEVGGPSPTHDCRNERSPRFIPNNHNQTHIWCVCVLGESSGLRGNSFFLSFFFGFLSI